MSKYAKVNNKNRGGKAIVMNTGHKDNHVNINCCQLDE